MIFGNGAKGETVTTVRGPLKKCNVIYREEGRQWAADNMTAAASASIINGDVIIEFDDADDAIFFKVYAGI